LPELAEPGETVESGFDREHEHHGEPSECAGFPEAGRVKPYKTPPNMRNRPIAVSGPGEKGAAAAANVGGRLETMTTVISWLPGIALQREHRSRA